MSEEQWKFLEDVFLSNAMRDSLVIRQGRPVFKQGPTTPLESEEREEFKEALKSELRNLARGYSSGVDEAPHIENIKGLAKRLTEAYAKLLNGDFVFGRAQKALNVYLKYLCEDWRKVALTNAEDWAGKIAIEKIRGKKIRGKKKKRNKKKSLSVFTVSGGLPFTNHKSKQTLKPDEF